MTRLRIAYFSPLPPARSGIADYSADLLPALAEHTDLTLFAAAPEEASPALREIFSLLPIDVYPARRMAFDLALYHIGNSLHHAPLLAMMRRYPGVMVLHEFQLHDLLGTVTAGQDDFVGYMREISYVRGLPGLNQLRDIRLRGQGFVLPAGVEEAHIELRALSMSERLVDLSLGVIVHSRFLQRLVHINNPARPTAIIPMLVTPGNGRSRRSDLPWPSDTLIFASAGFINAEKQLPLALRAFARLRQEFPAARYLIVGEQLAALDLPGVVTELGIADAVYFAGYAPDLAAFHDWLATMDVLINLRYPTRGETSAVVNRALAAGLPVIVNDIGWYAELPEDACLKVPAQDEEALLAAMRTLARDAAARKEIGAAGRAYARQYLTPSAVAAQYAEFLESLLEPRERWPHQRWREVSWSNRY